MLKSGFLSKVFGQSIFRGQQVDLLSWLCFVRCLLLAFFAFFYIVVSIVFRGVMRHGPTLRKIKDRFNEKTFFEITVFLERKIDKIGTDSKLRLFLRSLCFWNEKLTKLGQIQSCKSSLIIQSSVVSIKYRFDPVWFQTNIVSIKCLFDQVSFRSTVVRSK